MTIKHIAFSTDFSDHAEQAFAVAVEMAEKFEAKLSIIHVTPPVINPVFTETDPALFVEADKSIVLKLEEQIEQIYGDRIPEQVESSLIVLSGHISTEIIQFLAANQVDLIVMGSYGLTGMGLVVFGSVAKRVSHKAPCSVMIVRQRD